MAAGADGAPADAAFLAAAFAAGRACGVTRLADVTRLDRPGLPVWQAVRPAGRALSVHQGKGATPLAAQIGALCEAIESDCAERAHADGPFCSWADLALGERAPELADHARDRARPPAADEPIPWCSAVDALSGAPLRLPLAFVSLDYTTGVPSRFERSSAGLGAGPTFDAALRQSLLELVERDAVGEWRRLPGREQLAAAVDPAAITYPWFGDWCERLASLRIDLRLFRLPSFTGVEVVFCSVGGREEYGSAYRCFHGTAAAGDPESALFKALAEALQSRLAFIAGTRDDFLPSAYAAWGEAVPAAIAPRTAWDGGPGVEDEWRAVAASLARHGYAPLAVKRLDEGLDGVFVTKAFVPGLGSLSRTRRRAR